MANKGIGSNAQLYLLQSLLGNAAPSENGTAAVGTSKRLARQDHVHPSDSSKVPTTRKVNNKALSADITLDAEDVGALPDDTSIPTKTSDLTNDSGFITGYTETDPTVPSWAKAPSKPTYTAAEVGALPDDTQIPDSTSDLTNDSNFVSDASYVHTDNNYTSAEKTKVGKLVFDGNYIDSSILPSFVDDVIEAYPRSGQTELSAAWLSKTSGGAALTPETGKIYIIMAASTSYDANSQFRWTGSAYVKLPGTDWSELTNAEIDAIIASA